jgi:hypothetical protein
VRIVFVSNWLIGRLDRVGLLVARSQTVITFAMVDQPALICLRRNSCFLRLRSERVHSIVLVYSFPDSMNDARNSGCVHFMPTRAVSYCMG